MQRADAVHYLPGKTCYLLLLLVAFVKQLELVERGGDRGPFNLLGWICGYAVRIAFTPGWDVIKIRAWPLPNLVWLIWLHSYPDTRCKRGNRGDRLLHSLCMQSCFVTQQWRLVLFAPQWVERCTAYILYVWWGRCCTHRRISYSIILTWGWQSNYRFGEIK